MNRKLLSISLVVLALGLILAACSGDSGAAEPTTSAPTNIPANVTSSEPMYSDEAIKEGEALFVANCSACHGADATGVQGLGKSLRNNEFVQGKSDVEMMEFIKAGRPADDPLNTTGIVMPPKGGNPSMSDDQIENIIAFLRSLQE